MAPFHACIVVVVKWSSYVSVIDRVTKELEVEDHIPQIDSEAKAHVRSADFSLTQAERCAVLTFCFPCNRTARPKNDGPTHAAEFGERQLDAFANGITDLGAPASITVRRQTVMVFGTGRECIIVCFRIGQVGECHVGVEGGFLFQREREAVIKCQMDVMEDVKSGIKMTSGRFVAVGR